MIQNTKQERIPLTVAHDGPKAQATANLHRIIDQLLDVDLTINQQFEAIMDLAETRTTLKNLGDWRA